MGRWVWEKAPEMEYLLRHFTGQAVDVLLGKRELRITSMRTRSISEGVYACMGILQREGAYTEAILLQSAGSTKTLHDR